MTHGSFLFLYRLRIQIEFLDSRSNTKTGLELLAITYCLPYATAMWGYVPSLSLAFHYCRGSISLRFFTHCNDKNNNNNNNNDEK